MSRVHLGYAQYSYMYTTQIWTTLSVRLTLTKTKLTPNPNPKIFLKFLELIRNEYKMKEVQSTNCDYAYCSSYYPVP